MDIQTRKISLIEEFLKIKNEEALSRLENFIKIDKEIILKPMSVEEFNSRIDKSESDFNKGNFKSNSDLINKYK